MALDGGRVWFEEGLVLTGEAIFDIGRFEAPVFNGRRVLLGVGDALFCAKSRFCR